MFVKEGGFNMAEVGVIMGSISDWDAVKHTCNTLDKLCIKYEKHIISAHRSPDEMFKYAKTARKRGLKIIIAGAGGAAHLPGMVASQTTLPVISVPIQSKALQGIDSLLSIVQMPGGVPTATMAIGKAGAKNAGLFAAQILGVTDEKVEQALVKNRETMKENVDEMRDDLANK